MPARLLASVAFIAALTGALGTPPALGEAGVAHRATDPVGPDLVTDTLNAGEALTAGTDHAELDSGWYALRVSSSYLALVETIPVAGQDGSTTSATSVWYRTDPGGNQLPHDPTELRLRRNGDLVLRTSRGDRLWHSDTAGSGAVRLTLHRGGNFALHTASGRVVWRSRTGQVQMSGGMTLRAGGRLVSGWETAVSPGARITLTMQRDGNLVHRCGSHVDWQTHTHVRGSVVTMDRVGVLRVVAPNGRTVWSSRVRGSHDYAYFNSQFMEIRADGIERVWSARGVSGTCP